MASSWRRGAKLVALLGGAVVLTILTQVGGLLLLVTAWAARGRRWPWFAGPAIFLLLYAVVSQVFVPPVAGLLGRERLPCFASAERPYGAASPLYCALNRNYVAPGMQTVVAELAGAMAGTFPGTRTYYLDGNFPFLDGFPLFPHLSHDDGRKLDLAFYYLDDMANDVDGPSSPIGYWLYSGALPSEPEPCAGYRKFSLRWDFEALQPLARTHSDILRMRAMLAWLSTDGRRLGVKKVLLEPHLKARWAPGVDMIRFQGCRAARHDDHLHLELSKKN